MQTRFTLTKTLRVMDNQRPLPVLGDEYLAALDRNAAASQEIHKRGVVTRNF